MPLIVDDMRYESLDCVHAHVMHVSHLDILYAADYVS